LISLKSVAQSLLSSAIGGAGRRRLGPLADGNVAVINWLFDFSCDSRVGSVPPAVIQTRRRQNTRLELCGAGPPTANFSGALHEQRPLVAFFDLVCGLRGYVAVRTAAPTTPHSSLISLLRCSAVEVRRTARQQSAFTSAVSHTRKSPRRERLRGWVGRTRSAPGDRQGVGGASPLR
jgi:hypothetical protein